MKHRKKKKLQRNFRSKKDTMESDKYCAVSSIVKGKAVPQHTYGCTGRRGGIVPTHSRPRH
jgi:hypothetical protein